MSNIGFEEPVAEHDELTLVSVGGGGGRVYDCDGDELFRFSDSEMPGAEMFFPLIVRAYRTGMEHGERWGRICAKSDIRQALGL